MSYVDTEMLQHRWDRFRGMIPDAVWTDELEEASNHVDYEISDLGDAGDPFDADRAVLRYVREMLVKTRMGWYDESRHGNLRDVLEEIERIWTA